MLLSVLAGHLGGVLFGEYLMRVPVLAEYVYSMHLGWNGKGLITSLYLIIEADIIKIGDALLAVYLTHVFVSLFMSLFSKINF